MPDENLLKKILDRIEGMEKTVGEFNSRIGKIEDWLGLNEEKAEEEFMEKPAADKEPLREEIIYAPPKEPEAPKIEPMEERAAVLEYEAPPEAAKPEPKPVTPRAKGLEQKIGLSWLSKIGMIIVVLGVIYFLKYSFENNWIGPTGQILIGIAAGILLLLSGEIFEKKKYHNYARVMTGGGILIIYASLLAARHYYQILSPLLTLGLLVLITTVAVLAAVRYESQVIAVFGIIGAYIAPWIIGSSSGRLLPLLSYLTILNAGFVCLTYFRKWKTSLTISFILAAVIPTPVIFEIFRHLGNQWELYTTLPYLLIYCIFFGWALIRCGMARQLLALVFITMIIPAFLNYTSFTFSLPANGEFEGMKTAITWPGLVLLGYLFILSLIPALLPQKRVLIHSIAIFAAYFIPTVARGVSISPFVLTGYGLIIFIVGIVPVIWDKKEWQAVLPYLGATYLINFGLYSATPLQFSSVEADYLILGSVLFLNLAMLYLGIRFQWYKAAIMAVLATCLITILRIEPERFFMGMVFIGLSYAIFMAIPLANLFAYNKTVSLSGATLMGLATFAAFGPSFYLVKKVYPGFSGLLAIAFAIISAITGYLSYKKIALKSSKDLDGNKDRLLIYILGAQAITFVTLAVGLQFSKHWITIFWTLEGLLIVWAGFKTGLKKVRIAGMILLFLALIKILILDVSGLRRSEEMLFINYRFITIFIAGVSFLISAFFYSRYRTVVSAAESAVFRSVSLIAGNVIIVGLITDEIYRYFDTPALMSLSFALTCTFFTLYFLALITLGLRRQGEGLLRYLGYLLIGATVLYILGTAFLPVYRIREAMFVINTRLAAVLFFGVGVLAARLLLKKKLTNIYQAERKLLPILLIAGNGILLIVGSDEIYRYFSLTGSSTLPLLLITLFWALYAIGLTICGFIWRSKLLRLTGLSLFGLAILKTFIYDIWLLDKFYRIIAFICLGVLLLASSFLYHKYWEKIKGELL